MIFLIAADRSVLANFMLFLNNLNCRDRFHLNRIRNFLLRGLLNNRLKVVFDWIRRDYDAELGLLKLRDYLMNSFKSRIYILLLSSNIHCFIHCEVCKCFMNFELHNYNLPLIFIFLFIFKFFFFI